MATSATPRGARSLRLSAVQLPTSTGTEKDRAQRHSDCLENGIEPKPALKRLYGRTVHPVIVEDYEHGQSSSTSSSSSSVKQDHHQKDYAPVRPIGKPAPHLKKAIPRSVSLHADENMFKPRMERQKVFAGRRRKIGEGVPSLVQMCQSVLVANVDMIDHVGIVPYNLLAPALNHATTDQLRWILDANPMLAEDADEIFHELVQKEFPKYADREKDGWTWRGR